jgi:hypothetical protein
MAVTTVHHGCDQSGPSTARPTNAPDGFAFFDTTLNIPIFRDNTNNAWRNGLGADIAAGVLALSGGAPSNGTEGTGAGVAAPGCLYIDTANKKLYINTNTKASPTWTLVGSQT